MTTLNQAIKRKKIKKNKKTILNGYPQIKSIVLKTQLMKPRKPNSAKRKIALVQLKNTKIIKAYIPGERSKIIVNAPILIRGGNVKDLPGIKYKVILGSINNPNIGANSRCNKRSKYGIKDPLKVKKNDSKKKK